MGCFSIDCNDERFLINSQSVTENGAYEKQGESSTVAASSIARMLIEGTKY